MKNFLIESFLVVAFVVGVSVMAPQAHAGLFTDLIATMKANLSAQVSRATLSTTSDVVVEQEATVVPSTSSTAVITSLKTGAESDAVRTLQQELTRLGYYTGAIDGLYGSGTTAAIRTFQSTNGLTADGAAGVNTLSLIDSGNARANVASEKSIETRVPSDPSSTDSSTSESEEETLGQISMWYGKVNQHRPVGGSWTTDPDGTAGAGNYADWGNDGWGDRKLQYCQRFWPETTEVELTTEQTITGWRTRGNLGNYTSMKAVYNCLGESEEEEEEQDDEEEETTGGTCEDVVPGLTVSYENTSSDGPIFLSEEAPQKLGRFVLHADCDLKIKHIFISNANSPLENMFSDYYVYHLYGLQGTSYGELLASASAQPDGEISFPDYLEMEAGDTTMIEIRGEIENQNQSFIGEESQIQLFIYDQHVYDTNTNETFASSPVAHWNQAPYHAQRIVGWATPADEQLVQQ